MNKQLRQSVGVFVGIGILAAACSGGSDGDTSPAAESAESAASEAPLQDEDEGAEPSPAGEGLELSGETLDVVGLWESAEESGLDSVFAAFTAATGASTTYMTNEESAASGDTPDVVFLAQLGALEEMVTSGTAVSITAAGTDMAVLETEFSPVALDIGSVDGERYGLLTTAGSSSTMWYTPPSLEEKGFRVPETLDELQAMADAFAADGKTPFSVGAGEGWPITQWFENIYLRNSGDRMYDDLFRRHRVSWTDPSVQEAMQILIDLLTPLDERTYGGETAVTELTSVSSFKSILTDESEFNLIATWMNNVWKDEPEAADVDFDFFTFPDINPDYAGAMVLGGEFAVPTSSDPATGPFLEFLGSAAAADAWGNREAGGRNIPSLTLPLDQIQSEVQRTELGLIRQATTVVFDGSDMAPPAVDEGMQVMLQNVLLDPSTLDAELAALEDIAATAYDS